MHLLSCFITVQSYISYSILFVSSGREFNELWKLDLCGTEPAERFMADHQQVYLQKSPWARQLREILIFFYLHSGGWNQGPLDTATI
jgi:hypothetical protein